MSNVTEIEEDSEKIVKKKQGGFICRLEPNNTDWIKQFPRTAKLIQRSGWFSFCDKLQVYHSQLTMAFIENYDNDRVQLHTLTVRINEDFIAEAISVPAEGEKWFKQKDFKEDFSEFFILGSEKLDWKNGVHVSKMKPEWRVPLEVIQNYITCDGRYDRVLKCHLKLLMHIHGSTQLNLPFYLFKSLQKMVAKIRGHPTHTARSVYHQGLIKLLIMTQLQKEERTWGSLLTELGFSDNPKEKGKKMIEDANQQSANPTEIVQEGKNRGNDVVKYNLSPETPCTQENPEKLSDMIKSIASKKNNCKQLFREGRPRTRLSEKMQMEERTVMEDDKEVVVIEDAASEGLVYTAEDKYDEDMEQFIDMQGVAGSTPERFCTNKQSNFEEGSVSRNLTEERGCMRDEDLDISSEFGQCKRSLQTYKEQTIYLQDINEKLMVANKRLREYMENKEAEYQKLLKISKNILKEKRGIQRQLEELKSQNKESDKDVELARLQKRSQVLSDLAALAEASRSL